MRYIAKRTSNVQVPALIVTQRTLESLWEMKYLIRGFTPRLSSDHGSMIMIWKKGKGFVVPSVLMWGYFNPQGMNRFAKM